MLLELSLGNQCNANCKFCFSAGNNTGMSTKDAIGFLINHYKSGIRKVAFTGGEPTIRNDLPSLIRIAKKIGYDYVEVKTNIFMLSYDNYIQRLVGAGLDSVNLTIFGYDADTYKLITGVNEGYDLFINGMKNLNNSDIGVSANLLISKITLESIPNSIKILRDFNVKDYSFWYISTSESRQSKKYLVKFSRVVSQLPIWFSNIPESASIKLLYLPKCMLGEYAVYCYVPTGIVLQDENYCGMENSTKFREIAEVCKNCKLNDECDGVSKEYIEMFGGSEIER